MSDDDQKIGQWVQRQQADRQFQQGKWHEVQSMIAGDAITECGLRMRKETQYRVPGTFGAHYRNTLRFAYYDQLPRSATRCLRCHH